MYYCVGKLQAPHFAYCYTVASRAKNYLSVSRGGVVFGVVNNKDNTGSPLPCVLRHTTGKLGINLIREGL